MSEIKRRHFIQLAGSALATIGVSQLDIMHQGNKYAQALAKNTGEKYALLVGINEYTNITPLAGCVTDVLLQKELLIHRFGFKPNNTRILTDEQATRQNILKAFEDHLIAKAKPDDVVVFHFSGHGSLVEDPDKDNPDGLNGTLVPVDFTSPQGDSVVQDIMGHTLFLLMYALKTENVTVVLDSCHSGGAKRGNLRVRARYGDQNTKAIPQEFEYQRQWLQKLDLSKKRYIELRRQGIAKGVVISSAKRDQYAGDARFDGFAAGVFTYTLVNYLWRETENTSVKKIFADVSQRVDNPITNIIQNPELETKLKENPNPQLYFTPFSAIGAEAVITKTNGNNEVELWLGGIDPQSLAAFQNQGAEFSLVDNDGKERGIIKLESRQGLVGKGKLTVNGSLRSTRLKPGMLLQERIRGIPKDLTLKIGLDDSFDSNTTAQAKQALQAVNRVVPLPLRQQEVQYIFGRMTNQRYQELQKQRVPNLPPVGSLGLFYPSLDKILPYSFKDGNETIPDAVKRLKSKFKSLLAARIVKYMVGNTNTSRLKVSASMNIAENQRLVSQTFTVRGGNRKKPPAKITNDGIPKLRIGTQIIFQVENQESIPLYVTVLVIDAAGNMAVIFPNQNWVAPEGVALVKPGQKLIIGKDDGLRLTTNEPLGVTEALILASTSPLRESLKALQRVAKRGGKAKGAIAPENDEFLGIADTLLTDLDNSTRSGKQGDDLATSVRGVDTKKLAAMAITLEVVS